MATFGRVRFIKAVKIFNGSHFLGNDPVLVFKGNRLLEVAATGSVPHERIEFFDGILTPGFINAHCHLELSHLAGKLKRGTGFCDFALGLMDSRNKEPLQARHAAMQEAVAGMRRKGIVAVGDISNSAESFTVKDRNRSVFFHTFIELIGLDPKAAAKIFTNGLELLRQLESHGQRGSLAPHAPFSVSAELLSLIAKHDMETEMPLTIHNQESIEETRFLMGEICRVHELYGKLGIDLGFFSPPGLAGMAHLLPPLGGCAPLLVHNTFTTAADVEAAAAAGAGWCFCPRANLFIEGRQPDYSLFKNHERRICVGTDSLASNDSLDVLAELNVIAKAAPFFTEEQLLAMVCSNGAVALGISDRFGHLAPETEPGLNLLRHGGAEFELIRTVF